MIAMRTGGAGAGPAESRDLLDLMLAARDPENGTAWSADQLRDEVATMIVAGHETSSVALFWAAYLLASVPQAQTRALRRGA